MRSDGVVLSAPLLDDHSGFLQAVEDLLIEALVPEFAIEGLTITVLPWTAGLDVQRLRSQPGEPLTDDPGRHLCSIVRTDVFRDALGEHHIGQCFDDAEAIDAASNPDVQALASKLVDQGQQPDPATVVGLCLDKIVAPDMIAVGRPEPDARAVVEP